MTIWRVNTPMSGHINVIHANWGKTFDARRGNFVLKFHFLRRFKTNRLLRLHSRTHTNRQYDCNQCEKSFRSTQSLKRHLEYHTGVIQKPFGCDLCEKVFRLKANLVEHRRIHTGEKPHACEHCAANFRTISSYCAHMKKIHGLSLEYAIFQLKLN